MRPAPHLPLLTEGELQAILIPALAEKACVKLLTKSKNEKLKLVLYFSLYATKVNSYMVNLLNGGWLMPVTLPPSTCSRTARNIGHLQIRTLIHRTEEKGKKDVNTFSSPSSRPSL